MKQNNGSKKVDKPSINATNVTCGLIVTAVVLIGYVLFLLMANMTYPLGPSFYCNYGNIDSRFMGYNNLFQE